MDENRPTAAPPRPSAPVVPIVLGVQAAVLAFLSVACFAAAAVPVGVACLIGAVVATGLATSIHEGLPGAGSTVLGFEGAVAATALTLVSAAAVLVAAAATGIGLGWARRREARAQMRRPVPSQ
jgi:hypothetical protein